MVVAGVFRTMPSVAVLKRGSVKSGFGVSTERAERLDGPVATSSVAMTSLLAMQEVQSGEQQDRDAREHGEAVLDELAILQRALLGGDGDDLERLARLVERPVMAADPRLAGLLRAVRVRASIELARREIAASA